MSNQVLPTADVPQLSLLADVTQLAEQAGKFLLERRASISIQEKDGTHNLVTQADVECEHLVCARLSQLLPDSKFIREEGESDGDANSQALWVIDPLDGTNNYVHGIPQFCVSIALVLNGQFEIGVVYDPNRNEMFTAQQGYGAWLNGQAIQVSARPDLQQSVIATGFYYDRGDLVRRTLAAIQRLFDHPIRGIRRFGSAALDLCWVACGRYDGYFEYRLGPWDYSAGALIVMEAGGKCSDARGEKLQVLSGNVIASSPQIHDNLVQTVRTDV